MGAHPLTGFNLISVFLVGRLGANGGIGLFVKGVEDTFFGAALGLKIDFVTGFGCFWRGGFGEENVVADFALEGAVGDEAAIGLGIDAG
jgi:hypothetical protein